MPLCLLCLLWLSYFDMKLTFLGATETVTGSKFLLETHDRRVLIDCGLFQGAKDLRLRNWEPPPVDPTTVDAVVLTHAHIDHTGYLPRFVAQGYKGPVYATSATVDLAHILLPDSGHLQEEEARFRNKHRLSKHKPALPLYTIENAMASLELLRPVQYGEVVAVSSTLGFELFPAGHILGSAFVRFREGAGNIEKTVLFTGDIGRYDQPIIFDPSPIESADFLVLESTYGNRLHTDKNGRSGRDQLRDVILATSARGGTVLIPSFAIGRAQELLYVLRELELEQQIPVLPVYVDSPMAVDAVEIFRAHPEEHDVEMAKILRESGHPFHTQRVQFSRTVEQSKAINEQQFPSIIISANGMATGGRILHHLIQRLPDDRNSLVFVGFQAYGTRGRLLSEGARQIRIFGEDYPVRADVHVIDSFSAHGDYTEILRWLGGFKKGPRRTFLVHGEPRALAAMKGHIEATYRAWDVEIPRYLQTFEL
jgi:metallo-beta-lactamase family protein